MSASMDIDEGLNAANQNPSTGNGQGLDRHRITAPMDTSDINDRKPRFPVGESWHDLDRLLLRDTQFGLEHSALPLGEFQPGEETKDFLREECRVLVVGAGGLGCELLKDLALSGFGHLTVIDMDQVQLSNLNRQFLFREKDVGRSKAETAAAFITRRCSGTTVVPVEGRVQDQPPSFYAQFHLVMAGLDNVEARRWLNSMLHSLLERGEDGEIDPSSVIPLVDGGSEGLRGQARVIIPGLTSCFECSLESFPRQQQQFPLCTIAETPRLPQHCIAYAAIVLWAKQKEDVKLDADNREHMDWIYQQAKQRAETFGIDGVTYMLTLGVVKNIIPAVASTNAIISAVCVNEAVKLMSYCSYALHTYFMYMGTTGIYPHTFEYQRKENCTVCVSQQREYKVDPEATLEQLIEMLQTDPDFRLKKPSITKPGVNLFMQGPPALREATQKNLNMTLSSLVLEKEILTVTDPVFAGDMALSLTLKYSQ